MHSPHFGLGSYKNIRSSVSTTTTYSTAAPTTGDLPITNAPTMGQADGAPHALADNLEQLVLNDTPMTPAPPLPPSDGFRDITKEFFELSEKLKVGELVQEPYFTLLQAVGALEIMDPKMDSGLLEPEYESFDALKERSPEEIVGIMDRLLCHEMAWHQGHGMGQTLFTSLYIDKLLSNRPTKLADAKFGKQDPEAPTFQQQLLNEVLRPYCLALIKGCFYVNCQIMAEHTYEEEDFVTQTYGIPLLEYVETVDVLDLLDSTLVWLDAKKEELAPKVFEALKTRVSLRRSVLLGLSKEVGAYYNEPEKSGHSYAWVKSRELVELVQKTHEVGQPVAEAWSTSVQRKLASQVPPRPIVDIPFEQAMTTLKQLCDEMIDIPRILKFETANNMMNYVVYFIARTPTPLVFSRSFIQALFMGGGQILGSAEVKDILFNDLRELCDPAEELFEFDERAEAPQGAKYQITKHMSWFVERVGKSYIDLYRMFCQNRSRLRRNLCHTILDWDTLQVESEAVDTSLQPLLGETPLPCPDEDAPPTYSFPLSSWVYHYKLRQMEHILLLGFELEIYQPHEYAGMYWYLQHYLRTRIGHLERILGFVAHRNTGSQRSTQTLQFLNFQLLQATALMDLATAGVYLYTALTRLGILPRPNLPYGTDELRYELRMKPFLTIGCPEVVPFEIFSEVVDPPDTDTADLLEFAGESVAEAKTGLGRWMKIPPEMTRTVLCEVDAKKEVQGLLKSAFGLGVVVGVVRREMEAGKVDGCKVKWEGEGKGWHKSFRVPEVVVGK